LRYFDILVKSIFVLPGCLQWTTTCCPKSQKSLSAGAICHANASTDHNKIIIPHLNISPIFQMLQMKPSAQDKDKLWGKIVDFSFPRGLNIVTPTVHLNFTTEK